jgi:predicted oxidoreductase
LPGAGALWAKLKRNNLPVPNFPGFQSLFYWKYHFNNKRAVRELIAQKVSILVLLEVPLQQHFLILDSNDNTFGQFLQPLKLKFFTAN